MKGALALAAAASWAALCAGGDLYRIRGQGDAAVVSADRSGVPCDLALSELAEAMGWEARFQSEHLRSDLSRTALDLAFSDQGPRTLAHVLAVAGGADVVFNDRTDEGQFQTEMLVVSAPTASTETGRQRLRRAAVRWYRTFLREDLASVPGMASEDIRVRMEMAELLSEQGELQESARLFLSVFEDDPSHDYVPQALLRVAECNFAMGGAHMDEAERWARELANGSPSDPQTAAGTILLGRVLLAQQRYEEGIKNLTASYLRLSHTPEIHEVYLLVAEASYRLDRPVDVLSTVNTLSAATDVAELSDGQRADFLFLRGYALQQLGHSAQAREALEVLMMTAPGYTRRGEALVMLGNSYLGEGRYLQARAAAIEARSRKAGLDSRWAREASKLYARSGLEIGDKEAAFEDLEVEVRKTEEPELALYLMQAFHREGRYQKAIAIAEILADGDDAWADRARFGRIEAMWAQARTTDSYEGFPRRVIPLASEIRDEELQRRVAEFIGEAYERIGEVEKAADAYRGMLR